MRDPYPLAKSVLSASYPESVFYLFAEHIPQTSSRLLLSQGALQEHSNNTDPTPMMDSFMLTSLHLPLQERAIPIGEITEYTVEKGDTLGDIAASFNLKLSTLLYANNLSERSTIRPGQTLVILPVDGVTHTVKSGETLSSLSLLYQVYTEAIMEVNDISSDDLIFAGQILIIPGARPLPPPSTRIVASEPIIADVRGALVSPAPGAKRSQGLHWRNAVDLANSCGSPVVASASGTVTKADTNGWNGGFGKYVMIEHPGGFVTLYGHLSELLVSAGESVAQGERIGSIGATGNATGCHVHFEVRGGVNPFTS